MVEGYGINSDEMSESIYMVEEKEDQTMDQYEKG